MFCHVYRLRSSGHRIDDPAEILDSHCIGRLEFRRLPMGEPSFAAHLFDTNARDRIPRLVCAQVRVIDARGILITGFEELGGGRHQRQTWVCKPAGRENAGARPA